MCLSTAHYSQSIMIRVDMSESQVDRLILEKLFKSQSIMKVTKTRWMLTLATSDLCPAHLQCTSEPWQFPVNDPSVVLSTLHNDKSLSSGVTISHRHTYLNFPVNDLLPVGGPVNISHDTTMSNKK